MKYAMKETMVMLALVGAALLSMSTAMGRERSSWADVGTIWLDTNGCTSKLITELEDHDFALTNSHRSADAVLKVDVHQLDAHTGASARYSASLRDADGRLLMNTSGREDAISQKKLCSNITDDVLDRLSDRPLG